MGDFNNQIFVSPFLNFDPSVLVTNPNEQYLHLDGTDERSRFERSCCEIGGMVLGGGFVGSFYGMVKGMMDENIKTLPNKSIQRVQILNHITKTGGGLAQRFGTLGLIYAVCDAIIHKTRSKEDNFTTLAATTATGLLFSSTNLLIQGGWRRTVAGGGVGLLIGGAITGLSNLDKVKLFLGRSLNN